MCIYIYIYIYIYTHIYASPFCTGSRLATHAKRCVARTPPLFFGDSPNKTLLFDGAVNYDWHAA